MSYNYLISIFSTSYCIKANSKSVVQLYSKTLIELF
ncbi:hypothetical protein NC652_035332 [Populus alba x Populus x berolinensis]|nr:hypothetical protein NC652_035332 [Populus alba x Populus x berolinensis]